MSFFKSFFGSRSRVAPAAPLNEDCVAAVTRWTQMASPSLAAPLSAQRWLVVDVETSGLNTKLDRLLAIGAVLVEGGTIRLDHSFEVVIKQETASATDNILIHRIGGNEQRQGVDGSTALTRFLDYSNKLPCVAFHAAFDEAMLKRAFKATLGVDFSSPFIDLAMLAPALVREAPAGLRSLDDWVNYFSIKIVARHRAVADALGTAQLFQILLNRAGEQNCDSADALFKLAREQSWLAKMESR